MSARETIWGEHTETIENRLKAFHPDLQQYIQGFAYAEVYERPGLPLHVKELLAVVMLVSLGNPQELKTHFRGVVNAGGTLQDIEEALLFAVPYLGFPRVIGAFEVLRSMQK
ncbi:carboxymuconolactone decarboxylase family protein [Deinococcus roseus]|uniref:4-carboxymuconolactone decarboxylase n=1 Tax=Deinococcus roseus TaxID=392414 RepID=A0ABQ2D9K7_9DEIO|nr:carboxymuconolactone decarboxylase family protein [Deinococcus roseus]GGJ49171.1 4-carboxymuconolactone decarboxylase [Deinococcus roseus]